MQTTAEPATYPLQPTTNVLCHNAHYIQDGLTVQWWWLPISNVE